MHSNSKQQIHLSMKLAGTLSLPLRFSIPFPCLVDLRSGDGLHPGNSTSAAWPERWPPSEEARSYSWPRRG